MEETVQCKNELRPIDVLGKKNELERTGMLTEGLAITICRALELVVDFKKDITMYRHLENIQLVVQADGCWLEFRAGAASITVLVWYDQNKKEANVSTPFWKER
ncbi:hypothetical protein Y1Q_0006819 [Alligator mississippiensis]|uniref:Uncharacterized protein n=1 Tax=Alligator mississippiensis TaxID=8496 RepID=A0A151M5R2_ALLMI|nr:hypothetical protein Y1Q_0006819 [Alligator mississippiensis]